MSKSGMNSTTEEKKLAFIDLYASGATLAKIKSEIGLSHSVQHRLRKDLALPLRNRRAGIEAIEKLGRKVCSGKNGCGKIRPIANFHRRADRGVYDTHCKKCKKKKQQARQTTAHFKQWNINRTLFKNYGITIEQYYEIEKQQSGVCKICKLPNTCKNTKRLYVDHCHRTGEIRGLLCMRCNTGIGYFDDNPDKLRAAIKYLGEFSL